MDDLSIGYEWSKTHNHSEEDLHYITIMALKILDNDSQNDFDSKNILMAVYDGVAERIPTPFDKKVHEIIELSRTKDPIEPKEEFRDIIKNLRVALTKDIDPDAYDEFELYIWNNIN